MTSTAFSVDLGVDRSAVLVEPSADHMTGFSSFDTAADLLGFLGSQRLSWQAGLLHWSALCVDSGHPARHHVLAGGVSTLSRGRHLLNWPSNAARWIAVERGIRIRQVPSARNLSTSEAEGPSEGYREAQRDDRSRFCRILEASRGNPCGAHRGQVSHGRPTQVRAMQRVAGYLHRPDRTGGIQPQPVDGDEATTTTAGLQRGLRHIAPRLNDRRFPLQVRGMHR